MMRRILVVVTLLSIVLVGCGDDGDSGEGADGAATTVPPTTVPADEAPFEFDVTSVDFGYELATTEVPAGPVDVVQTNEGDEEHQVTVIRLEDGQTPDQLLDTITNQGDDVLDPAVFAGGPNSVASGESNSALISLEAGNYVTYCFIPTHAQQGMIEPFTVTGEATTELTADATETVGLDNFSFDVPDGFTGQGTVAVTNNGDQGHEMTIQQGDQEPIGGLTVIAPGQTAYLDLDLAPGNYTLVCFVTDPVSGQLHFQLGMTKDITVT